MRNHTIWVKSKFESIPVAVPSGGGLDEWLHIHQKKSVVINNGRCLRKKVAHRLTKKFFNDISCQQTFSCIHWSKQWSENLVFEASLSSYVYEFTTNLASFSVTISPCVTLSGPLELENHSCFYVTQFCGFVDWKYWVSCLSFLSVITFSQSF